ncbi:MAG: hypothetical protein JXB14_04985 [Candidatus Altiarchaeota archaeon]|nr:hypothetical protein [Candidatus Altiarchaeota archaeon]
MDSRIEELEKLAKRSRQAGEHTRAAQYWHEIAWLYKKAGRHEQAGSAYMREFELRVGSAGTADLKKTDLKLLRRQADALMNAGRAFMRARCSYPSVGSAIKAAERYKFLGEPKLERKALTIEAKGRVRMAKEHTDAELKGLEYKLALEAHTKAGNKVRAWWLRKTRRKHMEYTKRQQRPY